ncbi:MAG: LapA family protein [Thermodesulfobacteriota bacterium]|nr:LapA family protein [Thermodesulfobacteriota bacterium]
MKLLYTIAITLIMLFIITFSLANTSPVQLKYYGFIDVSMATYLLIFIAFGVGIIFAGFVGIAERLRLSSQVKKLKKKIKMLEKKMPTETSPAIQWGKAEEKIGM